MVEKGREATLSLRVDEGSTAAAVGSGLVPALATPVLVSLIEAAAVAAVDDALEEGLSSVGTRIDVAHLAPTPKGMEVTARATLEEVDGKRLVFRAAAWDEAGEVARGTHERYIIDRERFLEKLESRIPGSRGSESSAS